VTFRRLVTKLLACALLLPALPEPAAAQVPRTDDILGIYSTRDGTGPIHLDIASGSATVFLVTTHLSMPWGLNGWECHLLGDWEANPNIFYGGGTLMGQAINISGFPDFAVGLSQPLFPDAEGCACLASFNFIFFGPEVMELYLTPATQPSLPGLMCYAATGDPGMLIPFHWSSGDPSVPVFGFNITPPVPGSSACSWGAIKALYGTAR
jgi:hypothetical protein